MWLVPLLQKKKMFINQLCLVRLTVLYSIVDMVDMAESLPCFALRANYPLWRKSLRKYNDFSPLASRATTEPSLLKPSPVSSPACNSHITSMTE